MQNVLNYNLMADLPPDRLNHLGLGLNWLQSKTTMVRTKKKINHLFVIELNVCYAKTLPKALRTQALTALTNNFGLVGLVQYTWYAKFDSFW